MWIRGSWFRGAYCTVESNEGGPTLANSWEIAYDDRWRTQRTAGSADICRASNPSRSGRLSFPDMAKRCRSPTTLGRPCRVFRCFRDDEIEISDYNLNLLREARGPFAELLDGGGGGGTPDNMETIFQRLKISAPMLANLVMAAKGTLEVDQSRFETVAQAATWTKFECASADPIQPLS